MVIDQLESIFRCERPNHETEYGIYLCIKPQCQESSICCRLCIDEYHIQHYVQQFISLNNIKNIPQLNLDEAQNSIKELEEFFGKQIQQFKDYLNKLDVLKQFNEKPSKDLLEQISRLLKQNIKYDKITQLIKKYVKDITKINQDQFLNMNGQQEINLENEIILKTAQNLYWKEDKFDKALGLIEQLLQTNPSNVDALAIKGDCLRRKNQINEAQKYIDQALQINSLNKNALRSKAATLIVLKQFKEALKYSKEAFNIDKNDKYIVVTLSWSLRMIGNYKEANIYADQALNIDSNDKFILSNKANILIKLNQYQDALRYTDQALTLTKDDKKIFVIKAQALFYLQRYGEALQAIDQALIDINSDCPTYSIYIEANRIKTQILQQMEASK